MTGVVVVAAGLLATVPNLGVARLERAPVADPPAADPPAALHRSQAAHGVAAVFDVIFEALTEEKRVAITGFGTFDVRASRERAGVKPGTTERITIPARKGVGFKPSSPLTNAVK